MKTHKNLLLTLLGLITGYHCYSQSTPTGTAKACDGCVIKKNTSPCPPPTIVDLYFDECSNAIKSISKDGLVGGKSYVFRICNANDAFYVAKFSASNVARTPALPPILSSLNGNLSTSKATVSTNYLLSAVSKTVAFNYNYEQAVQNYYFVERFKFDYNVLAVINTQTQMLMDSLSKHPTNTDWLNSQAKTALDTINKIIIKLKQNIISRRTPYPKVNDSLLKIDATAAAIEEKKLADFATVNVYQLADFKKFVNNVVADFSARAKFVKDEQPSDEQSLEVVLADSSIRKATPFLLKCPDIIFAIMKSQCCIVSSPYQVTDDYLQLNISLLKPKFGDKQDTVAHSKLNFYHIHYWKWVDVSAGFFYDNLASKAYYFSKGVPSQEIKSGTDISLGALIHSYWVASSNFKVGPCAGIAVSALDGKSKYLLGGSIIIGRNNEWAFSGGYALASLPKPSNIYQSSTYTTTTTTVTNTNGTTTTTTTGTTPSNATTTTSGTTTSTATATIPIGTTGAVSTYNKYQGGFFIGITYSFLKF